MRGQLLFAAVIGFLCAVAAPVFAEQREFSLAAQPVYGLTYLDDRAPSGGGGNLQIAYGITDALSVHLMGGATAHPVSEVMDDMQKLPGGLITTWHATAGILYNIDIVRIVPFFEIGLGVLGATFQKTGGNTENTIGAGLTLGLGADYLITRRWAVGIGIRYHALLTDLGKLPIYLTVGPRVSIRFGV